ncbi:MAG: Ig-like domain-containing protein [Myxococcaceae bacterium]
MRLVRAAISVVGLAVAASCVGGGEPGSSGRAARSDGLKTRGDAIEAFAEWVDRYAATDENVRFELEPEGRLLLGARHEAFTQLLRTDPQRAIAVALTPVQRAVLPTDLAAGVETWLDGVGTLHVIGATVDDPMAPAPALERFVTFEGPTAPGQVFRASVFGQRAQAQTREHVRLHGVALDGWIAVTDSRLRRLFAGEGRPALPIEWPRACPISKKQPDSAQVYNGGDTLYGFCTSLHADQYDGTLAQGEEQAAADTGLPPSSTWTEGAKTVLYVRVDFPDAVGDPISTASAQSSIDTTVNTFYVNNSFGKTSMTATVTPTLRLPRTKLEYQDAGNYLLLRSDAITVARDAGYDINAYSLDVVAFQSTFSGWAGRAYVGSRGTWLNGNFSLGVTAHELGHNYGLDHANFWNSPGLTIIAPAPYATYNVEYGNPFDTMGTTNSQANHFNAYFKRRLDWVVSGGVATVSTSGTFRVSELEKPPATGAFHAIKATRDPTRSYWVEYRPAINTPATKDGVSINWGYSYNTGSHLLDLTPGDGSRTNSTLIIGRTFSDPLADLHFTAIGKGGTTPETVDVVVNVGPFPGNRAPTASFTASTQTPAVNASVVFTATASDPDGDALAWGWDFGDGTWGPNGSGATHAYSAAGDYLVRLVVSDMKGKVTSVSRLITVGAPTTFTLSGQVTAAGQPIEGVRISDGTRATFTTTDGAWTLTGVPAGSLTITATKTDFTFARSFAAPLTVAATMTGLDFTATAVTGYQISGKVTSGASGVAGVIVSDGTRTATTNATGDYALSGVPSGRYTLTATKAGWNFVISGVTNPVELYGANVSGVNFFATGQTLYGQIPMAGVPTAPVVTDGLRTVTAYNGGSSWGYSLSGVPNGTWNVTATSPGVTLTPTFSNPVTVQGASVGNLNFSVTPGTTYTVSGTVRTGGTPLPNVTISDGTRSATTDSVGAYTLVGVSPGTYTLTPTGGGYTFVPATLSVTVASANLTGKDFATTVVNLPPTIAAVASATPSPVTGTTTTLSCLGADDGPESALTYSWSASSGYPLSFSANGTNAAKTTTVTFTGASTYTFECLVTDPGGLQVRSSVVVQVMQTTSGLDITPSSVTLAPAAVQTFQSNLRDQFGRLMFSGTPAWSVSGGGTLNPTGTIATFTAGSTPGGPHTLTVTTGGRTANAQIIIAGLTTPIITALPSATPNPVTGTTTTLSVRATDDQGEPNLTYSWMQAAGPAPVTFAANGDNAAKDSLVTFAQSGDYSFVVTVADQQANTVQGTIDVVVAATATSLDVQPRVATVRVGGTQLFSATASDQFLLPLTPQPAMTWSVDDGGVVDPAGLFTAGATPGGPFTITASGMGLSATAQISVDALPDTQAPIVSVTAPIANARLTGVTPFTADATDDVAVVSVEFLLDGATSLGTATSPPWSVQVDVDALAAGPHVVTARATDAAGNAATSDGVNVIFGLAPADTTPPQVQLTAPVEDATVPLEVVVRADASDDVGVTQVDFELDGVVHAGAASGASWSTSVSVVAGAHSVVAIARDAAGNVTRSSAVSFTAEDGAPPQVIDPTPTTEPEKVLGSCGCMSADGSAAVALALVLISRARRRRAS